ncbi:hypothetical protein TCON_2397 [Astathelohania contejeani]|uniref:Uncharacterized protein n=1 Tax=Astathelohania contejeani TaxID=164912 RepID=A0ABQ7HW38_9MICR|nr:hypothetical protein TCON_2397 [Thelohania contejeani]
MEGGLFKLQKNKSKLKYLLICTVMMLSMLLVKILVFGYRLYNCDDHNIVIENLKYDGANTLFLKAYVKNSQSPLNIRLKDVLVSIRGKNNGIEYATMGFDEHRFTRGELIKIEKTITLYTFNNRLFVDKPHDFIGVMTFNFESRFCGVKFNYSGSFTKVKSFKPGVKMPIQPILLRHAVNNDILTMNIVWNGEGVQLPNYVNASINPIEFQLFNSTANLRTSKVEIEAGRLYNFSTTISFKLDGEETKNIYEELKKGSIFLNYKSDGHNYQQSEIDFLRKSLTNVELPFIKGGVKRKVEIKIINCKDGHVTILANYQLDTQKFRLNTVELPIECAIKKENKNVILFTAVLNISCQDGLVNVFSTVTIGSIIKIIKAGLNNDIKIYPSEDFKLSKPFSKIFAIFNFSGSFKIFYENLNLYSWVNNYNKNSTIQVYHNLGYTPNGLVSRHVIHFPNYSFFQFEFDSISFAILTEPFHINVKIEDYDIEKNEIIFSTETLIKNKKASFATAFDDFQVSYETYVENINGEELKNDTHQAPISYITDLVGNISDNAMVINISSKRIEHSSVVQYFHIPTFTLTTQDLEIQISIRKLVYSKRSIEIHGLVEVKFNCYYQKSNLDCIEFPMLAIFIENILKNWKKEEEIVGSEGSVDISFLSTGEGNHHKGKIDIVLSNDLISTGGRNISLKMESTYISYGNEDAELIIEIPEFELCFSGEERNIKEISINFSLNNELFNIEKDRQFYIKYDKKGPSFPLGSSHTLYKYYKELTTRKRGILSWLFRFKEETKKKLLLNFGKKFKTYNRGNSSLFNCMITGIYSDDELQMFHNIKRLFGFFNLHPKFFNLDLNIKNLFYVRVNDEYDNMLIGFNLKNISCNKSVLMDCLDNINEVNNFSFGLAFECYCSSYVDNLTQLKNIEYPSIFNWLINPENDALGLTASLAQNNMLVISKVLPFQLYVVSKHPLFLVIWSYNEIIAIVNLTTKNTSNAYNLPAYFDLKNFHNYCERKNWYVEFIYDFQVLYNISFKNVAFSTELKDKILSLACFNEAGKYKLGYLIVIAAGYLSSEINSTYNYFGGLNINNNIIDMFNYILEVKKAIEKDCSGI